MKAASVRAIVDALNWAQARYLIVGGLAVVAHGYVRYTSDVDLVIALDPENVLRALRAMESLGFQPRIPVSLESFADAALRQQWMEEKGMVVFQLFSDAHVETPVDVFITMPFDFDLQWSRANWLMTAGGAKAPVVALDQLLAMKRAVARGQDLIDVEKLCKLRDNPIKPS